MSICSRYYFETEYKKHMVYVLCVYKQTLLVIIW